MLSLTPLHRQQLARDALTDAAPIAQLARQHRVSRKFLSHQAHKAQQALDDIFTTDRPVRDDRVLFYLRVIKAWARQFVLALILIGHSSYRGVADAERRRGRKERALAQKLRHARQAEAKAVALAEDVAVLSRRLRQDILSVAGPEWAARRALFDFVVAELRAREPAYPHRIKPVRRHPGENNSVSLQYFLNHRRHLRSEHPDRVGKSPTELLTGEPHRHWLELLGYMRFVRN